MLRRTARRGGRTRESGYMLLILLLAVAMLTITLMTVETNYRQSIRRDREVEMIHRGVQYERAVRLYYRKYNSYPPSIDRLLDTNGIRFLRKRYKDPMTPDGNWRIATINDLAAAGGSGGTGPASSTGSSIFSDQSSTGGGQSSPSAFAPSIPGGGAGGAGNVTPATGVAGSNSATGSSEDQAGPASTTGPASTSGGNGPVLGGLAMIGVVSQSKAEGIHSFNSKSHYNQWYFIYDPTQDRGVPGLIPNGPYNPMLTASTTGGTTPGSPAGTPTTATPPTNTPTASPTATNP